MLLLQVVRAAASRTFWTAGNSRPIKMAMMAMTTSSSISVNARRVAEPGKQVIELSCKRKMKLGEETLITFPKWEMMELMTNASQNDIHLTLVLGEVYRTHTSSRVESNKFFIG